MTKDKAIEAILGKLTPAEKRLLAGEVASTAEKSYRRGYQHGFAMNCDDPALGRAIADWRFAFRLGASSSKQVSPPERECPKSRRFGCSTIGFRAIDSAGSIGADLVCALMRASECSR